MNIDISGKEYYFHIVNASVEIEQLPLGILIKCIYTSRPRFDTLEWKPYEKCIIVDKVVVSYCQTKCTFLIDEGKYKISTLHSETDAIFGISITPL